MALNSYDYSTSKLLQGRSFIVPINQRKYVWKNTNWRELLEDVSLICNAVKGSHFIGSIVLKTEDVDDGLREHFSIIDGQQRVLTISMLFVSIGYLYAKKKSYNKLQGIKSFLLVTDRDGVDHPIISADANIEINCIVEELFSAANKAQENNTDIDALDKIVKKAKSKNIRDCITYFANSLESETKGDIKLLDKYADTIEQIRYIEVSATTDEDAYAIFEVLNARGQELKDYDLLRNFLLKYSVDGKKKDVAKVISDIESQLGDKTEIFLKHYVLHKYGLRTDKADSRPYKIIVAKEKGKDVMEFLADLKLKAGYYHKIISGEDCSLIERKVFLFFKSHKQQQFRTIIMGLMHNLEDGKLSKELYEKNIIYLYKFFICYKIIGELASNKIDDIIDAYAQKLENDFSIEHLTDMKKSMVKRLPNENNFLNSFCSLSYSHVWKPFSSSKNRENVAAVLEYYEDILGNEIEIDKDTFNIEHCNPDSESQDNVIIGNLMLLEKTINDNLDSKPLCDKIKDYTKSKLQEPRIVIQEVSNGSFDMKKRGKDMGKHIFSSINELAED